MYLPDLAPTANEPAGARRARAWKPVAPTVWYLGITSLLTDLSSEMVASVLPVFLVVQLNLSPLAFGALDGLYNGVTALTRWASGIAGDRWRSHKLIAVAGYALSAACRLGLLAAGRNVLAIGVVIASDRLGKGIRTVPRDTLISLSTSRDQLANAFGVHRALDATGALLGPLCAFGILAVVPGGFDVVFVTSFSVAIVGVGVLVLFVENAISREAIADVRQGSVRAAIGLLAQPEFRRVVGVASGLGLLTISDAFIYLVLRERAATQTYFFPLLYVGTAGFYLLLAVPLGRLADRVGRSRVFLLGHVALLAVYGLLLLPVSPTLGVFLGVALLGAYYAGTDGVMVALASGLIPPALRGTGLALLTTATSLSRFVAAIAFGWVWTAIGRDVAVACFAVALIVGMLVASRMLVQTRRIADA